MSGGPGEQASAGSHDAEPAPVRYFAVMTLQLKSEMITIADVITAAPAATRAEIYGYLRDLAVAKSGPAWAGALTIFFSAEPNSPAGG